MDEETRQIRSLIQTLGEDAGVLGLEFGEDNQCGLIVDERIFVELQYFPSLHQIVVLADLGDVEPRHETLLCRAMLQANYRWVDNGGGAFALATNSSRAALMMRLDLADLGPDLFSERVAELVSAAARWLDAVPKLVDSNHIADDPRFADPIRC